jgi:hypothetical protein
MHASVRAPRRSRWVMRLASSAEPLSDVMVLECKLSVPLESLHQTNSSFNYRNPAPTMVMPAQTRNPDQATEANVPKIMTSKGHMDFLLALSAPQLHRCILEPVDSTLDRSAEDCDAREGESAAASRWVISPAALLAAAAAQGR